MLSSHLMYPNGFGVLQACQRARDPARVLVLHQPRRGTAAPRRRLQPARGVRVYRGLCEYAYGGRPTQSKPRRDGDGSKVTLVTTLSEGLPNVVGLRPTADCAIDASTSEVNGERIGFAFDPHTKELRVTFDLSDDATTVVIHHQNMFKHSNWPQRYAVKRAVGTSNVTVEQLPPVATTRTARGRNGAGDTGDTRVG